MYDAAWGDDSGTVAADGEAVVIRATPAQRDDRLFTGKGVNAAEGEKVQRCLH